MITFYLCLVFQALLLAIHFDVTYSQQSSPTILMRSFDITAVKILCNAHHCNENEVYTAAEAYKRRLRNIFDCNSESEVPVTALIPVLVQISFYMVVELTKDDNCFGPNQLLCNSVPQTNCTRNASCTHKAPKAIELGRVLAEMTAIFRCIATSEDPQITTEALRIIANSLRNFTCCTNACHIPLFSLLREISDAVKQLRLVDNERCRCATSEVDYCQKYLFSVWPPHYNWYPKRC